MKTKNNTKKLIATLTLPLLGLLLCPNSLNANEGQAKLFEPYAPKPSGKSPEGWEIKILEGSQVENSSTLSSGKEIKVTVPAYELVPKTNPETTVLKDPGFDPAQGTTQSGTIGAILTDYSEATVELQSRLEKVTKELEQSLGSPTLPKEEPKVETKESKTNKDKPKDKSNEARKSNSTSR